MDLDYTTKGKVGISMIKYIDKILEGFLEELGATAATPAAEHLFQVQNDSEAEVLSENKAQEFHHITTAACGRNAVISMFRDFYPSSCSDKRC